MNSDISCGKKNIYLDKLFNEKIERFLDNLFDYSNYSVAIKTNAFFFKEMLSITPQLLSSISPTTQYWYIETSVGIICCELHTNSYGEWAVLLKNISFYSNYMRMFQMKPKELGLVPHSSPLSFNNNPNKKYRVIRNAGYGLQIVKGKDGTFNYINSDGKLLYPLQWFKEVKPFNKTPRGIIAFVNNNGICNAIDSNGTIYNMNRAWKDCFTEGRVKKNIMTEAINKISNTKHTIRITESELKKVIAESVKQVLTTIPRNIGNWDCVPSNGYEFYDIPSKGKCVGIAMYVDSTTNEKIPPTYCLFRRGDNGKYFYATIVDAPEKGSKETKFLTVPVSDVPQEIYKDRHNLNLLY